MGRTSRRGDGRAETVTLADLTPDPHNYRTHPDRNLAAIRASLADVGAARSIVIDEGNVILAGNGVTAAALAHGLTKLRIVDAEGDEVIAVRRSGLTDDQKRALALFDNRTAELAAWDLELLKADADLGIIDLDTFWTADEAAALLAGRPTPRAGLTDPDAVPDERPTTITRGDLFQLGPHRLLCGDCTDAEDVGRLMQSARAGLCFTSPPYVDQRTYTDVSDLSPDHLATFLEVARPYVDIFAVNLGIVRREGAVLPYWDCYIEHAEAAGLKLLSWNVWSREGLGMSLGQVTAMFPIQHEWIFVFGAAPCALVPTIPNKHAGTLVAQTQREADGSLHRQPSVEIRTHRALGTVVTLPAVIANTDHPAQFPVELPREYLAAFTGAAYDPFVGAGTTIIAAEQLARPAFAMDIAPQYCQVAIDRWEAFTGQTARKV